MIQRVKLQLGPAKAQSKPEMRVKHVVYAFPMLCRESLGQHHEHVHVAVGGGRGGDPMTLMMQRWAGEG